MNLTHIRRLLAAIVVILGLLALPGAATAAPKVTHHNGQQLLGAKIKINGIHVIDKKGDNTVSVEARGRKIAGFHVRNARKGELPVTKFKTNMKLAQAGTRAGRSEYASYVSAQDQYLGTTYIGYSYVDEYGNEEIYWFPYDMILDGDTGAIVYVPAS